MRLTRNFTFNCFKYHPHRVSCSEFLPVALQYKGKIKFGAGLQLHRPTYAEVDLSAIKENIAAVRNRVGPNVWIMPAVKANGYGHGAIQVSRACIAGGANALCVACIDEAIELRQANFDLPILILGRSPDDAAEDIVRFGVTSAVCDLEFARELSAAAVRLDKTAAVHIKVDTGMGRIGVQTSEVLDFAKSIAALDGIAIDGLFTHFPCSDEADRSFTLSQIASVRQLVHELNREGVHIPTVHTSNSGGILAYPEADFDAVRPGIMTYGLYPSFEVVRSIPLREALTLKTRIVFLKEMDAGQTVSYGRTYKLSRKSHIATLPIGYADGYSRYLSNRGETAVRGVRAPVIGRVCMDQCLIDVTDVPGVQMGDEVVLYGGGYDYLNLSTIAERIGTISYELLCAIGNRIPRVYIEGRG